jgi:hypothetical protein
MVPSSLSILTQHFGRGGRSGEPTIAILFVETSVYQQTGRPRQPKPEEGESSRVDCNEDDNNNDDEEDEDYGDDGNSNNIEKPEVGPSYRKKIDENLRGYIYTLDCRRKFSNDYFKNPPRTACKFYSYSK